MQLPGCRALTTTEPVIHACRTQQTGRTLGSAARQPPFHRQSTWTGLAVGSRNHAASKRLTAPITDCSLDSPPRPLGHRKPVVVESSVHGFTDRWIPDFSILVLCPTNTGDGVLPTRRNIRFSSLPANYLGDHAMFTSVNFFGSPGMFFGITKTILTNLKKHKLMPRRQHPVPESYLTFHYWT